MKNWLNGIYLDQKNISKLNKLFLNNGPFSYLEFKNFLREEKAIVLLKNLQKEKFYFKDSDLFSFFQTNDLISTQNLVLKKFRDFFISKDFVRYIKKITSIEVSNNKLDLFASLYQDTHYLLPHDDRLDSRKIAYILFLSNQKESGALALYGSEKGKPTEIVKEIYPEFNKFILFKVSDKSYHEIREIIGDTQRIAITGWFHD